jgi:hypothetical protein
VYLLLGALAGNAWLALRRGRRRTRTLAAASNTHGKGRLAGLSV